MEYQPQIDEIDNNDFEEIKVDSYMPSSKHPHVHQTSLLDDHHSVRISVFSETITLDNITFYPVDNLMVLFKEYGEYAVTKDEIVYVPLQKLSKALFWFYLMLSVLAMLQRDDFANLTVAGCGVYCFEFPREINHTFYFFVSIMIIFTFIKDFWYVMQLGYQNE